MFQAAGSQEASRASADRGEEPQHRPVTPNDLLATFYRYFGIPLDTQFLDATARPVAMLPSGEPIGELI